MGASRENAAVGDPGGEKMLEGCMLRVCGRETWVLGGGWVESVKLGDYETSVVVDVTTDGASWDAAVGDAEELEIWAWEDDWLELW